MTPILKLMSLPSGKKLCQCDWKLYCHKSFGSFRVKWYYSHISMYVFSCGTSTNCKMSFFMLYCIYHLFGSSPNLVFFLLAMAHINVTHSTNHSAQFQMCGAQGFHLAWTPGKEIPDHQTVWIRQQLPHRLLGLTASDLEKHFLIS